MTDSPEHRVPFVIEVAGKLGPPVLAATLVSCLLAAEFEWLHAVLMGVALVFIGLEYGYRRRR